jgi:hypothetical protein
MHRDYHGYGAEPSHWLGSKQFVTDLHHRGVTREEAVEAVRQVFSVPRGAARLFVLSHPAWAEDEGTDVPWKY